MEYPEGSRIPLPWAVRGSGRALRQLQKLARRPDATLFHTSTISLGAPAYRTPYVVSVDATPLQVDAMGDWYRHKRSARVVERAKVASYKRVFGGARAMVAWSAWSARSLGETTASGRTGFVCAIPALADDSSSWSGW
ncbi:MAG: hypothetical protein R3B97_13975 [Dehalococcoidia bacterium]